MKRQVVSCALVLVVLACGIVARSVAAQPSVPSDATAAGSNTLAPRPASTTGGSNATSGVGSNAANGAVGSNNATGAIGATNATAPVGSNSAAAIGSNTATGTAGSGSASVGVRNGSASAGVRSGSASTGVRSDNATAGGGGNAIGSVGSNNAIWSVGSNNATGGSSGSATGVGTNNATGGSSGSATGVGSNVTGVGSNNATGVGSATPAIDGGSAAAVGSATATATGSGSGEQQLVHATSESAKEGTLFAIKLIAGLLALMVLAYLGGHRRVVRFQERLGIGGVITAGFPFVALGAIASHPAIGILNADVVTRLRPVLHFGLGWLGFIIGAQLDIRVLDRVPKGSAYLILVEALGPFAITAAGCGLVMVTFSGHDALRDPSTWRNMILLGTAAAMTAPRKFRGFANRTWHEGRGVDVLLGQLDEIVGVIGLVFITAYFRADVSGTWHVPDTAWVFISLGLGVAIGVLIFAMIRVPTSNAEFLAVVLGGIAFASGLAGYLRLSPIAICFIAGVVVTNFPNDQRESVFKILHHLERTVHLLFLMIAGALWTVGDWRGWVLVPLFVAGRILGKWVGVIAAKTAVGQYLPSNFADQRNWVTPLSGLSIALVVSVESLYHDPGLGWIVTAVIGGSLVTEILVSRTSSEDVAPRMVLDELERDAPVDELDDLDDDDQQDGPIYRDDSSVPDKPGGHE